MNVNRTKRPLAEIAAVRLSPLACRPPMPTETRTVVPALRSRTNTSCFPLVSPGTRLVDVEENAMKRPLREMTASSLPALPSAPPIPGLARTVVPVFRSWT